MLGSKDDIQDTAEVLHRVVAILDEFLEDADNSTVHPASLMSGIYFYFLSGLPEEDRYFLFDILATYSECSIGNKLRTSRDKKRFFQKLKKMNDQLYR